eukprot:TRINITY_DN6077_c0_g3_i1.p1 TRINITY_DN6077_c0_g3~~TRINITY_DN6077_c0_g3_i1.p1  ORF type:complete len:205 (+),score=-27.48 TRINITY_DN6077_c0_g3_i1:254-868(+)
MSRILYCKTKLIPYFFHPPKLGFIMVANQIYCTQKPYYFWGCKGKWIQYIFLFCEQVCCIYRSVLATRNICNFIDCACIVWTFSWDYKFSSQQHCLLIKNLLPNLSVDRYTRCIVVFIHLYKLQEQCECTSLYVLKMLQFQKSRIYTGLKNSSRLQRCFVCFKNILQKVSCPQTQQSYNKTHFQISTNISTNQLYCNDIMLITF